MAWEPLEAARAGSTKLADGFTAGGAPEEEEEETSPASPSGSAGSEEAQTRALLAKTWLRLGDLQIEQGHFEHSVVDYEHCLSVRSAIGVPNRDMADVHTCLASVTPQWRKYTHAPEVHTRTASYQLIQLPPLPPSSSSTTSCNA